MDDMINLFFNRRYFPCDSVLAAPLALLHGQV